MPRHYTLAVIIFLMVAVTDWLYILWVKAQPIINNSWFVVTPIIGYFYFTFSFIAAYYMWQRKRLGLGLAACVLMFGMTADVLSYSLAYNRFPIIEFFILPLITINVISACYLAYHQQGYSS